MALKTPAAIAAKLAIARSMPDAKPSFCESHQPSRRKWCIRGIHRAWSGHLGRGIDAGALSAPSGRPPGSPGGCELARTGPRCRGAAKHNGAATTTPPKKTPKEGAREGPRARGPRTHASGKLQRPPCAFSFLQDTPKTAHMVSVSFPGGPRAGHLAQCPGTKIARGPSLQTISALGSPRAGEGGQGAMDAARQQLSSGRRGKTRRE